MEGNKRIALVTGGARGLGLGIAQRLAKDGLVVVVADLDFEQASRAAADIAASGGESTPLPLDVCDEGSVARCYAAIEERFGGLGVLVNNAGIAGVRTPLETMSLADWDTVLRVNLTGAFLMSRGAIPLMKRQRWGRIVNISSQSGRSRTGVGKVQYAAAKAGMIGMQRVLAEEVGRDGITVNAVAPSGTLTPLTLETAKGDPAYFESRIAATVVGRLAIPEDTAHAVSFLCSEDAGFLTGAVIDVTGGHYMP